MTPPTLNVKQVARYLRVRTITVYKHAKRGNLPAVKIGKHWHFDKAIMDSWIENQENFLTKNLRKNQILDKQEK